MCKFYDAERVIFPCMRRKSEITILELINYSRRVKMRSKTKVVFDLSPASISNAVGLSTCKMVYDGRKIFKLE